MYGMSLKISLLMPSKDIVLKSHKDMLAPPLIAGHQAWDGSGSVEVLMGGFGGSCPKCCLARSRVSIASAGCGVEKLQDSRKRRHNGYLACMYLSNDRRQVEFFA